MGGWSADGIDKGAIILAADKYLVMLSERGDLSVAEASAVQFDLIWKMKKVLNGKQNWAQPVLVDGRLYLRDDEKIVCLDVK